MPAAFTLPEAAVMPPALAPLILVAPILLVAAFSDLRRLRIPNVLSLLMLAIFAGTSLVLPPPDLAGRFIAAGAVLAAGFLAFARGLVGAGDVKLLSALLLFIPTAGLAVFANLFSVSLLAGVALILALRRLPLPEGHGWTSLSGPRRFPMGISIALAGLAYVPVALQIAG
jgi:prepilin peptidase CpaA